uniref:Putative secreted protein n=1 Tax=Ixodes ricinus TaxID=34613 RepID=A0A6B0U2L1_IXORI
METKGDTIVWLLALSLVIRSMRSMPKGTRSSWERRMESANTSNCIIWRAMPFHWQPIPVKTNHSGRFSNGARSTPLMGSREPSTATTE